MVWLAFKENAFGFSAGSRHGGAKVEPKELAEVMASYLCKACQWCALNSIRWHGTSENPDVFGGGASRVRHKIG